MNWKKFSQQIPCELERLPQLITKHLTPPLYVEAILKEWSFLCFACNEKRVDQCYFCGRNVCEEHSKEIKYNFEWFICPRCEATPNVEERVQTLDRDLTREMLGGVAREKKEPLKNV